MEKNPLQPIINKSKIGKVTHFVLAKYNKNPSVKDRHFPARTSIPALDTISFYDEASKRYVQRTIQYIPSETSIYVDEQSEPNKNLRDKNTIRARGIIEFGEEGVISVEQTEVLKMEFLRKCNWNGNNPNRMPGKEIIFNEHRPGANATKSIDVEIEQAEVVMMVKNMDLENLLSYAKVLKVNIDREVSEIKHDMIFIAKKDPIAFKRGMENPLMRKMYYILQGMDSGVIYKNAATNTIYWANGNPIIQGRPNQDVEEELASYMTTKEDGKMVFTQLKTMLVPQEKTAEVADATKNGAVIFKTNTAGTVSKHQVLLDTLIEKGVIVKSGGWWKFKIDDKPVNIIGAEGKMLQHLDENPEHVIVLTSQLAKIEQ